MKKIQLHDISMAYKVIKNGKEADEISKDVPTMIVLHGGPGIVDHQIELEAWSNFSPPLQLIFLDQRGSGQTEDGKPSKWRLGQHANDVKEFCDKVGIEKPLMGGVSWGGYVIMKLCTLFPDFAKGIILCNTEAKVDLNEKMKAYLKAFKELRDCTEEPYNELGDDPNKVAKQVGTIACEYDKDPTYGSQDKNFEKFVKYCVPLFSKNVFTLMKPFRVNMKIRAKFIGKESLAMDMLSDLPKINCPVLYLAGDRDPTHPAACAKRTADKIPDCKLKIIKNAGAPVYVDAMETFVNEGNKFIEEIFPDIGNDKIEDGSHICQI